MTDKLNLSGGLRYTWEDVTIKQSAQSLLSILKDTNQKASKPSWLVGIDYKVTPQLLVYFNHRGSWRTGGFNGTSAASFPNAAAFLSETTYDFELGTKYAGRINGLPAHLNLAVYDQYISNVQRAPYLNQSALGGNVNAAEVKGVEADGGITLVKGFEIGGSVAYTNAKYTDPIGTVPGVGKFFFGPYADTPKWQASAYFRASTNLANDVGELALRGEVYNQSSFYYGNLANSNVPNTSIDGYTLVNARAEWNNMLGSKVNAAAYVNNLLDKNYYTGGFPLGAVEGLNSALVGNPRLWGLELGIKF
jgi:iron complex outermembrane receptor protein